MRDQTFEINLHDESHEVKMTMGLLNELCRVAGDVDAALLFSIDHDLREAALKTLLSARDSRGKITNEFDLSASDISIEDTVNLLDWAGGHVCDFFLSAAERAKATGTPLKDRLEALRSS